MPQWITFLIRCGVFCKICKIGEIYCIWLESYFYFEKGFWIMQYIFHLSNEVKLKKNYVWSQNKLFKSRISERNLAFPYEKSQWHNKQIWFSLKTLDWVYKKTYIAHVIFSPVLCCTNKIILVYQPCLRKGFFWFDLFGISLGHCPWNRLIGTHISRSYVHKYSLSPFFELLAWENIDLYIP